MKEDILKSHYSIIPQESIFYMTFKRGFHAPSKFLKKRDKIKTLIVKYPIPDVSPQVVL